jgi:hypothetical protein
VVRHEEPALLGTLVKRRFAGQSGVYTKAAAELGLPAIQLRSMMPPPPDRTTHSPVPKKQSARIVSYLARPE